MVHNRYAWIWLLCLKCGARTVRLCLQPIPKKLHNLVPKSAQGLWHLLWFGTWCRGDILWLEGKGDRLQQALHCKSTLVVVFSEVTLLSVTDPLGPNVHVKSIGSIGSASYRIPALEEIVVGCRNQCNWSFMNFYYEEAKTKVCMRMKWLLLCPCTSCISLPTYICSSFIGYGMPSQLFLMLDWPATCTGGIFLLANSTNIALNS